MTKTEMGCVLTVVNNGLDALALLGVTPPREDAARSLKYDLVVTDQVVPGLTGLELCLEIIDAKLPVPKVLLTGSGSENLASIALKSGVDDYIIKDPQKGYLDLLPVVLPEVVRMHRERLARERAEALRRESEARHTLLLQSIGHPVVALSHDLTTFYSNASFAELVGRPGEQLEGKGLLELAPHWRGGKFHQACLDVLLTGAHRAVEFQDRDGRFLWANVFPSSWGALATLTDLTEQRRMEKALLESEQRYRLVVDHIGEGIVSVDLGETITLCNPAAEVVFGVPPGTLQGRNLREFLDAEGWERIQRQSELRHQGLRTSFEMELKLPNGGSRTILVTASPHRDAGGNFAGSFMVFRDITEAKRQEAKMRADQEMFRQLIENSNLAVGVLDREGRLQYVNNTAGEMVDLQPHQMIGRELQEFLEAGVAERAMRYIEQVLQTGRPLRVIEAWDFQGRNRWIWADFQPMEPSRAPAGVLVAARDVTAERQIDLMCESAQRTFRALVEGLPTAVMEVSPEGRVAYVNAAAVKLLRLEGEVAGRVDLLQAVAPESREALAGLLRGGEVAETEVELIFGKTRQVVRMRVAPFAEVGPIKAVQVFIWKSRKVARRPRQT